jgi:hypothetical protein
VTEAEDGRRALEQFVALYERARQEGEALRDRYRSEGDEFWENATEIQLQWLRKRLDATLEGLLLPGGRYPFGMAKVLSEFDQGEEGASFERASRELERFWSDGLGVPAWDWQTGVPPGWSEAAAQVPRVYRSETTSA